MRSTPEPSVTPSALSPFRHRAFAVVWTATVISNVGTWMYTAACGWLMTSLSPDPLSVSLVQVATSLPMFLFAIPAGALADMIDKRRFLLIMECVTTVISAIFALLVWQNLVNVPVLLVSTFLIGACGALAAPAWQSIVPQLVPKTHLAPAVTANGVGINVSRAIGPAMGGAITSLWGIATPFWINAGSNLGVVASLIWWKPPKQDDYQLPAERFFGAIRAGIRHAGNNFHLRATFLRAIGFFLFASAYWALLPLVARDRISAGPAVYGSLLGAIGLGAVGGAFALPWLKAKLGPDRMVAAGTAGTALTLCLYAFARDIATALAASLIAGASWIAVLSSLNVSAQVALPDWVRGRGLALFATVLFGAMTAGSMLWGKLATLAGLPAAHLIAGVGALLSIPCTWQWKLQTATRFDLTPSMHWPAPTTTGPLAHDDGPVLITVEYRIAIDARELFLRALNEMSTERRRDGAYRWGVFEDVSQEGRYVETFLVESWLEHLRQHNRVTKADQMVQDAVLKFQLEGTPKVSHFVAARPKKTTSEN